MRRSILGQCGGASWGSAEEQCGGAVRRSSAEEQCGKQSLQATIVMQGVDLMRESWQLRNRVTGLVLLVPGGSRNFSKAVVYVMYVVCEGVLGSGRLCM